VLAGATGALARPRKEMIPIHLTTRIKTIAVVAACATAGAVAGITAAAAAPSSHSKTAKTARPALRWARRLAGRGRFMLGVGPAVHETAVVLNRAGTGFITETEDSGTVQSISGNQLTVKEGIGKVTYRTVTLTIPSGATVYRDFASSSLSALRSGDRVRVAQSSEGTTVFAIDSSLMPPRPRFGRPGAWAPPPGAAPGAMPPAPGGAPPAGA